jgi:hypothetical protein
MSVEASMNDVRTLRWTKTCSVCGEEMPAGTELVQDMAHQGPRGGKVFKHAHANECVAMRSNPYMLTVARRNPGPMDGRRRALPRLHSSRPAYVPLMRRRNPRFEEPMDGHDLAVGRYAYEAMMAAGRRR